MATATLGGKILSNKTNFGGTLYESVGSSSTPFLIKSNGIVRLLWGNSQIDLIKDGKIASGTSGISVKIINSEKEILTDGFYLLNNKIILRTNSTNYYLLLLELGTSDMSDKQRTEYLKRIGLVVDSLSDLNITNGIVYDKATNKVYKVVNGYAQELDTTSNVSNVSTSNNVDKLNANTEASINVGNDTVAKFRNNSIYLYENVYFGPNAKLTLQNGQSTLTVDNIIWRNLPVEEDILIDPVYAALSNMITGYSEESGKLYYILKYDNKFQSGDDVIITYESVMQLDVQLHYEEEPDTYQVKLIDVPKRYYGLLLGYPEQVFMDMSKFETEDCTVPCLYDGENIESLKIQYKHRNGEVEYVTLDLFNKNVVDELELEKNILEVKVDSIDVATYNYIADGWDYKIENPSPNLKFPIKFKVGDELIEINETSGHTDYAISYDNLYEDDTINYKTMFDATNRGFLRTKIVESKDLMVILLDIEGEVLNCYIYKIDKEYIYVSNGKLMLNDYSGENIYFRIGTEGEYHSYSANQQLENPSLVNPKISGTLKYLDEVELSNDYDIPHIKWVKSVIPNIETIQSDVNELKETTIPGINKSMEEMNGKCEEIEKSIPKELPKYSIVLFPVDKDVPEGWYDCNGLEIENYITPSLTTELIRYIIKL